MDYAQYGCVIAKSPQQRWTLDKLQAVAASKGGKLISAEYTSSRQPLVWQCRNGHQWKGRADMVTGKQQSWCRQCYTDRSKTPLEVLQKLAIQHGGACLATESPGHHEKALWRCASGHEWRTKSAVIKRGYWCPECAGQGRLTMEKLHATAASRGGMCLATEFKDNLSVVRWKCAEGHEWDAKVADIRQGSWCHTCKTGVSERMVRAILEGITGATCPKAHPEWLTNNDGKQMELDGFSEELRLAFEYQGMQHYKMLKHLRDTPARFLKRIIDDAAKRRLCASSGVTLIEVPHWIKPKARHPFILEIVQKRRPELVKCRDLTAVDFKNASSPKYYRQLKVLAEAKGGLLLSSVYLGSYVKLRFRCKEGHEWETLPSCVKQGSWCQECFYDSLRTKRNT